MMMMMVMVVMMMTMMMVILISEINYLRGTSLKMLLFLDRE